MNRILILVAYLALTIISNAQTASNNKSISLTVTGRGNNIDIAVSNALRNALEQAYGTFMLSSTKISNDELVSDEIISVSNGNIEKYDKISEIQLPSGEYLVTLKANVSLNKLSNFLKNKGYSVEFDGNLFANNIKMLNINEDNEAKIISKNIELIQEVIFKMFDYKISAEKPQLNTQNNKWLTPIKVSVISNYNSKIIFDYLNNILKSLSLSKKDIFDYKSLNVPIYNLNFVYGNSGGGNYNLRSNRSIKDLCVLMNKIIDRMCSFKISKTKDGKNVGTTIKVMINEIDDQLRTITDGIYKWNYDALGRGRPQSRIGKDGSLDFFIIKESKQAIKFEITDELDLEQINSISEYSVQAR